MKLHFQPLTRAHRIRIAYNRKASLYDVYAACAVHNVQLRCTYALRVRYVMHSFAVHTYYARCIRVVHTYSEAIRVHRA